MESLRRYIFTLICMAILCGLVTEFFSNSPQKKLLKFAAGILMVIVAITPLIGKERIAFNWNLTGDLNMEAQEALRIGQEQADGMLRQIITQQTQAYILDKATSMGAELSVEVALSDTEPPIPEAVVLSGNASPYVRKQLSHIIITDLGISEDKLQWNY